MFEYAKMTLQQRARILKILVTQPNRKLEDKESKLKRINELEHAVKVLSKIESEVKK